MSLVDRGKGERRISVSQEDVAPVCTVKYYLAVNREEKAMVTHSNVLGSRIPGTGQPGGLQSMG